MDCPKCVGKLQKTEVEVSPIFDEKKPAKGGPSYQLELDKCFSCGGVWFDAGELNRYLSDQLTVMDSPELGGGLDQELDKKTGICPRCQSPMQKTPAPKLPDMTVDVCRKCQGVWLDSTEIDRLEKAHKPRGGFLELFRKGFRRS